MSANQVVYVIRADGLSRLKVGISNNPDRRLARLATAAPAPLTLWHVHKPTRSARETEARIHHDLRPWHSSGEWFEERPGVWDYLRDAIACPTPGEPPVAEEYRERRDLAESLAAWYRKSSDELDEQMRRAQRDRERQDDVDEAQRAAFVQTRAALEDLAQWLNALMYPQMPTKAYRHQPFGRGGAHAFNVSGRLMDDVAHLTKVIREAVIEKRGHGCATAVEMAIADTYPSRAA